MHVHKQHLTIILYIRLQADCYWVLLVMRTFDAGNVCNGVQRQKSVDRQFSCSERNPTWIWRGSAMYSN